VIDAELRRLYGPPAALAWEGDVSEYEYRLGTYNPERTHDVTMFITNGERLALIRKPHFDEGVWRTPGGGIKPGEDVREGIVREALEETGLAVEPARYLLLAEATFRHGGRELAWRTHVVHATTDETEIAPIDLDEIEQARWGTAAELAGPLRERLLATGRAFWRYRVALHDAALESLGS
jgi:ADP-ribose pyrophosphatase YjhB (NUDIX family)